MRDQRINIRISSVEKNELIKICAEENITFSTFILRSINSPYNLQNRNNVFDFIRKENFYYKKVENNINQFAHIANLNKNISENMMGEFNKLLADLLELKQENNMIFKKTYTILSTL